MISLDYSNVAEVCIWFVSVWSWVSCSIGWSEESVFGLWQFLAYGVDFGRGDDIFAQYLGEPVLCGAWQFLLSPPEDLLVWEFWREGLVHAEMPEAFGGLVGAWTWIL